MKLWISFLLFFFLSCVSSPIRVRKIDQKNSRLILYSSADQHSLLYRQTMEDELESTIQNLRKKAVHNSLTLVELKNLINIEISLHHYQQAEHGVQKILKYQYKDPDAKKLLAMIAIKRKDYDRSKAYLNTHVRDDQSLNMLGIIAAQDEGGSSRALRFFYDGLKLNKNNISIRMNLGVLFLKFRLLSKAKKQFLAVLKIVPEHIDAQLYLAIIETAEGKIENASKTYSRLLKWRSNEPMILFNYAYLKLTQKRYDESLEILKRFLEHSKSTKENTDKAFFLIKKIQEQKLMQGGKISVDKIRALEAQYRIEPNEELQTDRP